MRNTSVEDSGYYYCELMVRGKEPIIEEVTKLTVYDPATIVPVNSFEIESFDDTVRINCPIPTVGKIMKAVQFNRNYTDLDSAHHKTYGIAWNGEIIGAESVLSETLSEEFTTKIKHLKIIKTFGCMLYDCADCQPQINQLYTITSYKQTYSIKKVKRNEGRSITIQCCQGGRLFVQRGSETSKPFPMNDVRITMSIDKENIKHFTIRNLSVSDSGTYSCVSSLNADQCLGSDIRTELRVRIKN